MTKKQYYY